MKESKRQMEPAIQSATQREDVHAPITPHTAPSPAGVNGEHVLRQRHGTAHSVTVLLPAVTDALADGLTRFERSARVLGYKVQRGTASGSRKKPMGARRKNNKDKRWTDKSIMHDLILTGHKEGTKT